MKTLAALLLLAGCASTPGTVGGSNSAASLAVLLTAAERDAAIYAKHPPCPTPGTISATCADHATILKLQGYDNAAYAAVKAAEAGSGSVAAAQAALTTFVAATPK